MRVARPAGRCVFTGISGTDSDLIPVSTARRKELCVQWCRRFCHNFPAAIALVAAGKIDVAGLITHSFPLERTAEAFDLVAGNRDDALRYLKLAEAAGETIADEESKKFFVGDLADGDWHGVK